MAPALKSARRTPPRWGLGDRLRLVRRDLGLSQADMAAQLNVGAKSYAAWESGANRPSDVASLAERLEDATGISRSWWLGWETSPSGEPQEQERRALITCSPRTAGRRAVHLAPIEAAAA